MGIHWKGRKAPGRRKEGEEEGGSAWEAEGRKGRKAPGGGRKERKEGGFGFPH